MDGCVFEGDRRKQFSTFTNPKWNVEEFHGYGKDVVEYFWWWPGDDLDRPAQQAFVIYYDQASGLLEKRARPDDAPESVVTAIGWVQESFPRGLQRGCPAILGRPFRVPINEAQTALDWHEMLAQDPNAPLRGYTGKDPVYDAWRDRWFDAAWTGEVMVDSAGHRYVVARGPRGGRDQLWRLDAAGGVEAVAEIEPDRELKTLTLVWEDGTRVPLRYADPWPLEGTGRTWRGVALMKWLAAKEGVGVHLPIEGPDGITGGKLIPMRFHADGKADLTKADGTTGPGKWWLQDRQLFVKIEGVRRPRAYPLDRVAVQAGLPAELPPLMFPVWPEALPALLPVPETASQ